MPAEPIQYLLPHSVEQLCAIIWRTKLGPRISLWICVWPRGDAQELPMSIVCVGAMCVCVWRGWLCCLGSVPECEQVPLCPSLLPPPPPQKTQPLLNTGPVPQPIAQADTWHLPTLRNTSQAAQSLPPPPNSNITRETTHNSLGEIPWASQLGQTQILKQFLCPNYVLQILAHSCSSYTTPRQSTIHL